MPQPARPEELPPPELVGDEAGMRRLAEALDGAGEAAVDTEADSFFSYREKVCLLQVSVGELDFVVDPLTGVDITPLGRAIADPDLIKVFHDGEYDVLLLKRDHGFEFRSLFDTRIAASALGETSPGLASVLSSAFGIELDKSLQRSNWGRRPLTPEQISYARLDTRYLVELSHRQKAELEARGRIPVVDGECRRIEALEPPHREFDPDGFVRIKGARKLDPAGRRALRELFIVRDGLARERDVPPFKVLSNTGLLEVAAARPRTIDGLATMRAISPRQARRIGPALLEALERAKDEGPLQRLPELGGREGTGHLSDDALELHERLKSWRKVRAESEGMDASLILNRHVLVRLAETRPSTPDALTRVEGLLPWQLELFQDDLLEVVSKFEADRVAGRLPEPRRRRRGSSS